MELQFLICTKEVTLNSINFGLPIGWDFQIDLIKMNNCMLWFNKLSIQVLPIQHPKQDVDPKVRKFPTELNFVVFVSAVFTVERSDDDFSEEWNFGEEDGGVAILLAVCADAFNDSGWIERLLRSLSALMSAKITSG